jgi:hypothetical protein
MEHNASGACWVFFVDNLCVTPAFFYPGCDNSLTFGLKMGKRLLVAGGWLRLRDCELLLKNLPRPIVTSCSRERGSL